MEAQEEVLIIPLPYGTGWIKEKPTNQKGGMRTVSRCDSPAATYKRRPCLSTLTSLTKAGSYLGI